jgi:hypothetical protein
MFWQFGLEHLAMWLRGHTKAARPARDAYRGRAEVSKHQSLPNSSAGAWTNWVTR